MPKPTIKDIAKALDINVSTVSRALKDHPDISKRLKEKIKLFADSLGYTPNEFAVGLRRGKSMTIGLIIPEISMYFFPSIIQAVEEMTHKKNYHLMVLHSNNSLEREIKNARICSTAGVDGLLVSLSPETEQLDHFANLSSNHIPIVFFDKVLKSENNFSVEIHGELAAYNAVTQLFSFAKRPERILGIFGDRRLTMTMDRLEGFTNALQAQGVEVSNRNLLFANDSKTAAILFEKIYTSNDRPDAVFIMSDELLAGVCEIIRKHHIKVPEDLSMIAMSDGLIPRLIGFNLPYVHTSGYQLGKQAASLLFDLIEKKDIDPDTFYIDTPFIS